MSEPENKAERHVDPLHLITVILIIIAVILLIILIIPRPKEQDDKAAVSTATPVTNTDKDDDKDTSKASAANANVVTDFDKQAVASAINQDLVQKLGQENFKYVNANDLTLSKENSVIKAAGNYSFKNNGKWSTKGLSYTYKVTDDEYELVDADISQDVKKKDKSSDNSSSDPVDADLSLTQSYSINVKNTLSITANASSGELRIDAVDADGNATTVFDETGPFNISDQQVDLDPGSYTLNLYSNASGWSFHYSTR